MFSFLERGSNTRKDSKNVPEDVVAAAEAFGLELSKEEKTSKRSKKSFFKSFSSWTEEKSSGGFGVDPRSSGALHDHTSEGGSMFAHFRKRSRGISTPNPIVEAPPAEEKKKIPKCAPITPVFAAKMFAGTVVFGLVTFALVYALNRPTLVECPQATEQGSVGPELKSLNVEIIRSSKEDEICTLTYTSDGVETELPVARSYSGYEWEGGAPTNLEFSCSSTRCTVQLPPQATYRLTAYKRKPVSTEHKVSRFLSQATFGATRNEINALSSQNYEGWIQQQIREPPNLHREYYRKRVNPRVLLSLNVGRPRRACERHSRWRNFAIITEDRGKTVTISDTPPYILSLNGYPRTELSSYMNISGFAICEINELSGEIKMGPGCSTKISNPEISFTSIPSTFYSISQSADTVELDPAVPGVVLLETVPPSCEVPSTYKGPIFLRSNEGLYYIHDTRLQMLDNSVSSPADSSDGVLSTCPNAPMSFLNEEFCSVGNNACKNSRFEDKLISLDVTTIRLFYEEGAKYVYSVSNLGLNGVAHPCKEQATSRWLKKVGQCSSTNNNLDQGSLETIVNLLNSSEDANSLVRDIYLPRGPYCNSTNGAPGVEIEIIDEDGEVICWEHVHPDLHNVYDFSLWSLTNMHPGNVDSVKFGMPNPITKWALDGSTVLPYPTYSHAISRWTENKRNLQFLGRLGDEVNFNDMPEGLKTREISQALQITELPGTLMRSCGSPGEVASDSTAGARYGISLTGRDDVRTSSSSSVAGVVDKTISETHYKSAVWAMIALFGKDQLRQRVAWALSQILVISVPQLGDDWTTENYLTYYDIFVRHAFGSYRDILKEVSFSPMMGQMLSSLKTKSYAYQYARTRKDIFPDENYAREIMQLFSIGLYELNNDGTKVLQNGEPVEAYTNEDIMTFARVWTGFEYQKNRANIEQPYGYSTTNKIDPMRIISAWRDRFPKMNLHKGYIGDRYPRCSDQYKRSFLRTGATYRFLGSDPTPELQDDISTSNSPAETHHLVISSSSNLYAVLCNPNSNGDCQYRSKVVLNGNVPCNGIECEIDTVRVVKLQDDSNPDSSVYYEYVRSPCVEFAFFTGGKTVARSNTRDAVCVDPKIPMASEACCSGSRQAQQYCEYPGERVSYETAKNRCSLRSGNSDICDYSSISKVLSCETSPDYYWADNDCNIRVKIRKDGQVAVIHAPSGGNRVQLHVSEESKNFFRVNWNGGFPSPSNQCNGIATCETVNIGNEEYCICDTTVDEEIGFSPDSIDINFDRNSILARLHIGAFAPDSALYDSRTTNDIQVFSRRSQGGLNKETIFRVSDDAGKFHYLRNIISTVRIVNTDISFRNPPHFLSLVEAASRDAHYEIDATLDHFFYHHNTAPFISYRLIQRLVTANPSPRYVASAANAFRTGKYGSIGSGKYGDIGATVAAVLLDREARSSVLDADPANGQFKEPILKLFHFMRSMEITPVEGTEIELRSLQSRIGQAPHYSPDVFSFFKPEFSPPGPLGIAGIASPESEVLNSRNNVGFLNGMLSLARFGLNSCYSGFGKSLSGNYCRKNNLDTDDRSMAKLGFSPTNPNSAADVIAELDTLLTNGRLGSSARKVIENEYQIELDKNGPEAALRIANQLFLVSSEFQSTNLNQDVGRPRPSIARSVASKPYKAIVYFFLGGGCDSFNVLVPHSRCQNGKANYEQYADVRTNVALPQSDLLVIDSKPGSQVCDRFGLHPKLVNLRQRYNQKEMLFMANTGVLSNPITKDQFRGGSAPRPKNLFAHNVQQRSTKTLKPMANTELASGVLGRMKDELTKQGYSTGSYSLSSDSLALEGENGISPETDLLGTGSGVPTFMPSPSTPRMMDAVKNMSGASKSLFGETWYKNLHHTMDRNPYLNSKISNVDVTATFSNSGLARQFKQVAKVIKARTELGVDRDVFYVSYGGFDTHARVESVLDDRMEEIDDALNSFITEMKDQEIWDSVTIVQASEFARTLTSNGDGTDHAWGGNYYMLGGSVAGGKIIGSYPDDLTNDGQLNIGRGRIIPTTSWDSIWYGIAQWFGVDSKNIGNLVDVASFPTYFTQDDLYN